MAREDGYPCCYGNTLFKDPTCSLLCSWASADPATFLIRGKTYLEDRKKARYKNLSSKANVSRILLVVLIAVSCVFDC